MFLSVKTEVQLYVVVLISVYPLCVILEELGAVKENAENDTSAAETLFKRLYKLERNEQLAAIKALLKLEKPERKQKMLEAIAAKVLYVIEGSKLILDDDQFVPGVTPFPSDERIRDALSNVLENTAFLGDIIVRLPTMSQKVLQQKSDWLSLFQWSLNFTNQSNLVDSKTVKLLDLVSQVMNFKEKGPEFSNPYSKEVLTPSPQEEGDKRKKQKKRKVIPKGPRISRLAGEL